MLGERKFLNINNHSQNYEKLIKQISDKKTFKIKSDYSDEYFHIMILLFKITSIKKIDGINIFIDEANNHNKMFIIKKINKKVYNQFIKLNNTEVFFHYELLVNIIDHDLQPKFELLSKKDTEEFYNSYKVKSTEIPKMLSTDKIARYYNAKPEEVFRIIRPSITTGYTVFYRKVVKSDSSLLFIK